MSGIELKSKKCGKSGGSKATQFKKGGWNPSKQRSTPSSSSKSSFLPDSHGAVSGSEEPKLRLSQQEAVDVQFISQSNSYEPEDRNVLAYSLRPRTGKEKKMPESQEISENIIVSVSKMAELVNHVHATTCKQSDIKVRIVKRNGLCVYASVRCNFCGYNGPVVPMSDTIKKQQTGPEAGALNQMAVVPVLKSKVGMDDVRTVLTCLGIKAPSSSTLQRKLNNMANCAVEVNEQQMLDNQTYVARVMNLAGTPTPSADCAFDVCYTCRPQGGCEKAAQSFGVLVENTTSQKLPVALAVANKFCRKKACSHQHCAKTFPTESSIASSERVLLHRTLDKVENDRIIKVASITTDAGTQSAKAIRDWCRPRQREALIHYKCLVHKLRAVERHIKQLHLKSIPKTYDKTSFLRKLASSIRARVRLELTRRIRCKQFVEQARAAILNITKCFCDNHERCRQVSSVCTKGLMVTNSHLPYGQPLKLSAADLKTVDSKLSQLFNLEGLQEVRKLYNTNKCESINSTVFQYAPKSTCWSRNFNALCHSATHSRTVGPGKAIVKLATSSGVCIREDSVLFNQLKAKDTLRSYHKMRKASALYKQTRYFHRKRKMNKALFQDSVYSADNASSCSAIDHNYGLKV